MTRLLRWTAHHLIVLLALLSAATLLSLALAVGFWVGGSDWTDAVALGQYLCLVFSCPSALLWFKGVLQDFRRPSYG